jgi:hypothetical protein
MLRELRIHLCPSKPSSLGVLEYLSASYSTIKNQKPSLPILVRPTENSIARVFMRYDKGREESIDLESKTKEEVALIFKKILS